MAVAGLTTPELKADTIQLSLTPTAEEQAEDASVQAASPSPGQRSEKSPSPSPTRSGKELWARARAGIRRDAGFQARFMVSSWKRYKRHDALKDCLIYLLFL
jgi:hypothetical protein